MLFVARRNERNPFLSTPSARRATLKRSPPMISFFISIHALREEGDDLRFTASWASENFYPRPPRGGRHVKSIVFTICFIISIHALREEGDRIVATATMPSTYFYPRPPRGGRRTGIAHPARRFSISIHALREEGDGKDSQVLVALAISIHALREEGDEPPPELGAGFTDISIHALREEGDTSTATRARASCHFYPRPPRGGRPFFALHPMDSTNISIHALREEGDSAKVLSRLWPNNFYPRPPRGGRRTRLYSRWKPLQFLSTPSARRATDFVHRNVKHSLAFLSTPSARRATQRREKPKSKQDISIHALREEGDNLFSSPSTSYRQYFYPRPPRGGRRVDEGPEWQRPDISIHALREEGD